MESLLLQLANMEAIKLLAEGNTKFRIQEEKQSGLKKTPKETKIRKKSQRERTHSHENADFNKEAINDSLKA